MLLYLFQVARLVGGNMIRVLIADDDAIIREGLKMIIETQLDLEFLGAAIDGNKAVELCRCLKPDVVMLDIRMPVMDGIQAAQVIMEEKLSLPLLLTTFDEPDLILRALKAGVNGYILKNSPAERILSAIRLINTGGTVFQADVLEFIRSRVSNNATGNNLFEMLLSPRELEVVKLISEGLSNKEIGEKLFLTNGTVRNHISTILEKTGLEHRTQIAVHYLKNS
ncbi:MAG: Response regulator containing a CheY-like receiver domain and an DNA-binding domain [Herbinix sp.]|jgi:DNA-binding NarL/FixJ family response regulator|nr:Response regulator containing a CheY-like receiver domain and an DNA-binding domain [Herbinix sp.]